MFNLDHTSPQFGSFIPTADVKMPWGCYTAAGELAARAPTKRAANAFAKRFGYKVSKID